MFLDDFDFNNSDDIERLFNCLDRDKFNSLSEFEKDEVIDKLISLSGENPELSMFNALKLVRKGKLIDLEELISEIGLDEVKRLLRETISEGNINVSKLNLSDVKDIQDIEDILQKLKDGNLSDLSNDDYERLLSLRESMENDLGIKNKKEDKMNLNFSSFALLHLYCDVIKKNKKDEEVNAIKDAEPFINSAFIATFTSLISNNNSIKNLYDKHGIEKVRMVIDNDTMKITDILISYCEENDISPERALIALLNSVRVLGGVINTSLEDYDDVKDLQDAFTNILGVFSGLRDNEEFESKIKNGSKNDISKDYKSANADNKESQKTDIQKLLFDD